MKRREGGRKRREGGRKRRDVLRRGRKVGGVGEGRRKDRGIPIE